MKASVQKCVAYFSSVPPPSQHQVHVLCSMGFEFAMVHVNHHAMNSLGENFMCGSLLHDTNFSKGLMFWHTSNQNGCFYY